MATGTISVRVRPVRFAFLVDFRDEAGLRKAIQINSLLWGGADNPIISVFRRTPAYMTKLGFQIAKPDDFIAGQVEAFDPDLVVAVGKCADRKFQIGHRDQITCDDLLGNFSRDWVPDYGIGGIDLIDHLIEQELRFERRQPLKLAIPEIGRAHSLFLRAVVGDLPPAFCQLLKREYSIFIEPKIECNLENYAALLDRAWLFPRRVTTIELKPRNLGQYIFLCDATQVNDIIDYWNLRAAGFQVIPIPRQAFEFENVKAVAVEFVNSSFGVHRDNPSLYFQAHFQLSASISDNEGKAFVESLRIPIDKKSGKQKYSIQGWQPTLFLRGRSGSYSGGQNNSYAYERDFPIQNEQDRLDMRSYGPEFEISGYSSHPRFANDFSFSFYGASEPVAEVIPAASREMSNALGRTGYSHWRFSPTGPVFLSRNTRELIFLQFPHAEVVVKEWLKERHWLAELSSPGKIAKQIFTRLGGTWALSILSQECLLQILSELIASDRGMGRPKLLGALKKGLKSEWGEADPEGFLETLIEKGVLRLGAEVQCSVCSRHNWYELDKLGYSLVCRYCLSEFKPPLDSPKAIEWTYRPYGLFAIENHAHGAYCVLLTLRFLGRDHDRGISPLFSYEAKGKDAEFEADLTVLYKSSTWQSTEILSVHAECKSYNSFATRDVNRIARLAKYFPGSVLIFSTFRTELHRDELKMLIALVYREWRKRMQRKPYSSIVVLTGTELFSTRGLPYCWEGKGGRYEMFTKHHFNHRDLRALAEATQRIYLGVDTFHTWASARSKTKSKGVAEAKAMIAIKN